MQIILIDPAADLLAAQFLEIAPQVGIVGKYTHGLAGLEAALAHPPDAVFLNLDLPDTGGLMLLQSLVAASIQVIAASEWSIFEREAQRLGAIACLVQPSAAADVRAAFQKILRRVRRRKIRKGQPFSRFKSSRLSIRAAVFS